MYVYVCVCACMHAQMHIMCMCVYWEGDMFSSTCVYVCACTLFRASHTYIQVTVCTPKLK